MKKLSVMLSMLTLLGIALHEVGASSVGGGIYVPVQQIQPASACPTGHCRPGNTCAHCAGLGLACVDGATTPPCAASGTCRPKSDTYGYFQQKWRSWPGEESDSEPQPTLADEDVIDPPAPEKEDLQAPPAIEESVEAAIEANQPPPQPLDIQLPPLQKQPAAQPRPAPADRPAPVQPPAPGREAPPVLPFGWKAPAEQNKLQAKNSADEIISWIEPKPENYKALPIQDATSQVVVNANLIEPAPAKSTNSMNSPPVMPAGLISTSFGQPNQPSIRRLPSASGHRLDAGVVPTSAVDKQ